MVREPFGLITLEGMAAGTAVVAVAEGGFTETVDDGRTGLLTARDPHAFGAAVARVLEDRELAGRLAEAGRREARERWTWERTAEGYDRLLTQVAGLS
jgi:glycosyltransferase involved in cell wall biosynthesis